MSPVRLSIHPLHLGLGATAVVEPAFTGELAWYEAYEQRHAADGAEGRLVSIFEFDAPWTSWEMHPNGAEVVLCLEGQMRLWQETQGGEQRSVLLGPGQLAINAPGVWHTADVEGRAKALFITAGLGTQHRAR